jgi:hypothetical protein
MERCRQQDGILREVIERDSYGKAVMVRCHARSECMLDAYLIRKIILLREHEAGMIFQAAWLRARCGVKVIDRYTTGTPVSYEAWLDFIPESERILKEAHDVLSRAQKTVVIRVCWENKLAGGTDKIETLRRGLKRMADWWSIK